MFPSAVAADLPPQIAESLANHQLPLNHTAFEAPVDTAAWRDKPTFCVISTKDKVIAPEAQKLFATGMKAQTTEVAGSHASLVVHAQEVAALIEKAAPRPADNRAPGAFVPGAQRLTENVERLGADRHVRGLRRLFSVNGGHWSGRIRIVERTASLRGTIFLTHPDPIRFAGLWPGQFEGLQVR